MKKEKNNFPVRAFQCHATHIDLEGLKTPTGRKDDQKAIYTSMRVGRGLELRTSGLRVSTLNRSAMLPSH